MRLSGADLVVPMGGMMRASDATSATRAAARRGGARRLHAELRRAYRRAALPHGAPARARGTAASSPSACGARSRRRRRTCRSRCARAARCGDDEGTHNTKVDVPEIPTGEALYAPIEGEEHMAAATIFHHSPAHRWWYFPDMKPDEVIFIKFYDSDHGKAWRCPHTAFRDHDPARCAPASLDGISRDRVLLQELTRRRARRPRRRGNSRGGQLAPRSPTSRAPAAAGGAQSRRARPDRRRRCRHRGSTARAGNPTRPVC